MTTPTAAQKKKESALLEIPLYEPIASLTEKTPTKIEPLAMKTQGAKRIFIELEDDPKKALLYARKYNELVSDTANILKEEYPMISPGRFARGIASMMGEPPGISEFQFVEGITSIIFSNLNVKIARGGAKSLWEEFLEKGIIDCDLLAFFVYDVAKQCNINAQIVIAIVKERGENQMHASIKSESGHWEFEEGGRFMITGWYPRDTIGDPQILKEGQIQSITYLEVSARAFYYEGDDEDAIANLNRAIALNPSPLIHYTRAYVYARRGKYDQAVADLEEALKLDPKFVDAYDVLGAMYIHQEDYNKALIFLNKGIEIDPSYATPYNNRGWVYFKQGKYDEALEDLNKAIKLDPNFADAYDSRAELYEKIGENDLAKKDRETLEKLK